MPRSQPCRKIRKTPKNSTSVKLFLSSRKTRLHPPVNPKNQSDPCFPRQTYSTIPGIQKEWASFNTVLPPAPLLVSSRKQSVISRLNHSFADPPYRSVGPTFSRSPEMYYSPTASPPISTPASSPVEMSPMSFLDTSIPQMDIPISKALSGSSPRRPLSRQSSFCPDQCRMYIANLPETLQELSPTVRRVALGKRRGTSPVSLTSNTASRSPESGTSRKYRRVLPSNDASTQTSPMVPAPSILLSSDQKNMDLSCPSQDMQQLIASDLALPKCCLCGAPQEWEKTTTFQAVCERLAVRYYTKCPGDRWFDGYDGQPVILIDEFSDSSFTCCQWNAFCNPTPPVLEVKGSKLVNLSTHYVVLANRGAGRVLPTD